MHPFSWLPRSARGARYLAALAATPAVLALASAHALAEPVPEEEMGPDGFEARAGASGLPGSAGSGSGGAAGSGSDGLGGSGVGGSGGGRAGSSGRDGARPLNDQIFPATSVAKPQLLTTLRRGVQLENGSEQAPGDQAGSLGVQAPTAGLMVTANGSCGDEADQVGVARNPRDRAP